MVFWLYRSSSIILPCQSGTGIIEGPCLTVNDFAGKYMLDGDGKHVKETTMALSLIAKLRNYLNCNMAELVVMFKVCRLTIVIMYEPEQNN